MLKNATRLYKHSKGAAESGAAMVEFAMVFPLLTLLFLFVAVYGWYWWNQTTAATAIHRGVYAAAIKGGSARAGHEATQDMLHAALGGAADSYEGNYYIIRRPGWRSDIGGIENKQIINIPWVGPLLFTVKAQSVQRHERFYGGRPTGWE